MNKRNLFVRITAIILCAIMVLGVFSAALSALAYDVDAVPSPVTGSPDNTLPILIAVIAILAVVACIVVPRIKKKK